MVLRRSGQGWRISTSSQYFNHYQLTPKESSTQMSQSPFKCSVCRRSFSSHAMLKTHYQEHQKQTRHCGTCGANYKKNAYHRC
ncbi:MAG: hypothetical protein IPN69_03070 [Acidobacteria bacterium]|nr:hypothetical protein [Acidobacteriota bacterium]